MSKYRLALFCSKCDHKLTNKEYAYSRGVCPYCGNDSGCTFVDEVRRVEEYNESTGGGSGLSEAIVAVMVVLIALILFG